MPLDASIILGGRGVQLPDQVEQLQRFYGLQNALEARTEATQARQRRQGMDSAIVGATRPDGTVDTKGVVGGLTALGYGTDAQKYAQEQEQHQYDRESHAREAQAATLKLSDVQLSAAANVAATTGQFLQGVTDQATLDQARAGLANTPGLAPVLAKMPTVYNEGQIGMLRAQSLTTAQTFQQAQLERKTAAAADVAAANNQTKLTVAGANNETKVQVATANNATKSNIATANIDGRAKIADAKLAVLPGRGKPLPATLQKSEDADIADLQNASNIATDISAVRKQIASGELSFSPTQNALNRGANFLGISTAESQKFAAFKAQMEKLRNDSLRLNKGVQTEGDAQRAWNEMFANLNDTKVVEAQLAKIEGYNQRAAAQKKQVINNRRANYGQPAFNEPGTPAASPQQPAATGGRTATLAQLQQAATAAKITLDQARARFEHQGGRVIQ